MQTNNSTFFIQNLINIDTSTSKYNYFQQGKKATYIPQLAYTDENLWAVAVETVDGRTFSIGDTDVDFSLQSCSKPLIYSLAVEELGAEYVSNYMGYEPSGNFQNVIKF